MLETFTLDTFTPLVGGVFRVRSEEGAAHELRLVSATPSPWPGAPIPHGPTRQPFSLVFRADPDVHLPQRIYPIESAALGSFELFLVPIGPDAEGMRYEAVFG